MSYRRKLCWTRLGCIGFVVLSSGLAAAFYFPSRDKSQERRSLAHFRFEDLYWLRNDHDRAATSTAELALPITVNGTRIESDADSGTSITVLNEDLIDLLPPLHEKPGLPGKPFQSRLVYGPVTVMACGREFLLDEIDVADLGYITSSRGKRPQSILGMDVLRFFTITLDSRSLTYSFKQGSHPPEQRGNFVALRFLVNPNDEKPSVAAKSGDHEFSFLIDTANTYHCTLGTETFELLAEDIVTRNRDEPITWFDGSKHYRAGWLSSLCLGSLGVLIPRPQFEVTELPVSEWVVNTIGLHFLVEHDAVLDFPGSTLYLRAD